MAKLKSNGIFLKICELVNLKVLNANLTGFSFSQNLFFSFGPSSTLQVLPFSRMNIDWPFLCEYAKQNFCFA